MRAAERLSSLITTYSTAAIVVMLVATAIIGAGMVFVDQEPGLDQFEFETEEGDALEYIGEHFEVEDNETAVQIVIRDQENALSRESFIATLELQEAIEDDPRIEPTLADEPFQDLAAIVATESIRADQADELQAEEAALENESDALEADFEELNESFAELENESAELNESFEELEADGAELEEDAAALEERRTALEADEAALENRTDTLQAALEETAAIQTQVETGELTEAEADAAIQETWTEAQREAELDPEQNATFEAVGEDVRTVASLEFEREAAIEGGPAEITDDPDEQAILRDALNETVELQTAYDEAETDEERAEIDATIEETWDAAAANATLSAEQEAAFRDLGQEVRDLTAQINEIGPMPALFEAGTAGVLEDEIAELEERGAQLEADAAELEEREQDLEDRREDLEERADELEQRGEELEQRAEELQDRGDELEQRGEQLADDFEALADIDPTREEQREHLENMTDEEVEDFVGELLGPDANRGLFIFVPTDFDPGDTQTDTRTLFVSQTTDEDELIEGDAPERIVDSQLAIAEQVNASFGDRGFSFGVGIITDEIDRSMTDSLTLVLPLAFLFVLIVLSIAYRDPLDIVLGLAGIALVLVWTFGFVGWTGIVFNQIMIAVPVLLVGLSIDYAIHVFMRHRERRSEAERETRKAMFVVLLGLGAALIWVTITAVIGFLSNLVSPVGPIREFGIVSAWGIIATLLIFGVLIPASKITLDNALEARGWDRRKRAFGTGGGRLTDVLNMGNRMADRLPVVVILVALLLTGAGAYGGMQVDTEFNQEDFMADEPPDWMDRLPGFMAPGEYSVKPNLDFVNERFLRQDTQTQILIRGDVADDDALEQMDVAATAAADEGVVIVLPNDEADVRSPLTAMQDLADDDEDFNETFTDADTTGDRVPDRNVSGVYDAFFEADQDRAERFLHRTDGGEYEAARMTMSIRGGTSPGESTTATRNVAGTFDGERLGAIATGQLVVFHIIEDSLFDSVIESLLVTMVVVFAFLMVAYRIVHGSDILGAVTLTPIMFAVAWILGTMYLLGIPFNVITGTITSLTIGLGVAYNIHISERYRLELGDGHEPVDAMRRAVTGTGGALLGSAATTMGGFGVLLFAILPPLQQFGLITALTILYAFLGSVFVLPSLLRLWSRWLDPEARGTDESAEPPAE